MASAGGNPPLRRGGRPCGAGVRTTGRRSGLLGPGLPPDRPGDPRHPPGVTAGPAGRPRSGQGGGPGGRRARPNVLLRPTGRRVRHGSRCCSPGSSIGGGQRPPPPRPRPTDGEYVFKHALVQEVAYESLLRRSRRTIHERVARGAGRPDRRRSDDCTRDRGPPLRGGRTARPGGHALPVGSEAGRRALRTP